jgi:hypothetical protein
MVTEKRSTALSVTPPFFGLIQDVSIVPEFLFFCIFDFAQVATSVQYANNTHAKHQY